MGRKGVISSHAKLYSMTERKGATQIAARSTAPISDFLGDTSTPLPHCLEPCVNELFWVLVDQFVKGVAEGRFTKHTRGSLRFVALSFIKKKFGTQMEIDNWKNGTSYTLHQAILVQFRRNWDYETVCWETTHPDKLYHSFGSLQFGHASLIRQIPSFASPCEFLVSIFRSLWQRTFTYWKNCILISNI